MKIYRPLWSDGAFLAPQQFQQQARWESYLTDTVAQLAIANPWGVLEAEFDEGALAISRLNAIKLIVRFPDGSVIDTAIADNLPPAVDLSSIKGKESVDIVLALPLLQANGGNLAQDGHNDRPRRYQQEWVPVQDLIGNEMTDIAIERYAITLRYSHEENGAYLVCPVARLIRNSQGQWTFDRHFIPPMLACSASQRLMGSLTDLMHRLKAKRRRLMSIRRESNERMADFAVADVSLFWLLNALNSAEPVLAELLASPTRHPELLYRELVRLAGSLLTFSLEHQPEDIPAYQHLSPGTVFPPLFALLNELLEASLPSRVIPIELAKNGQFWKGDLNDSRLREEADFYLSVRSSLSAHLLQTQFPLLCKVGSPDEVANVVNVALNGVPLKALSHVPAAIPMRLENQYFALELNNISAKSMLDSGHCAFYVPGTLGDVQLELFAVLRS
ncbi:type VI secretion system baseplate subunit TssK [Xenorhabdus sp. PB30.3]|uniref:type VI secretion system baseplate subunit TssK n=1 Tax=Xenorhabdus sp. PB30.3 TaxID=2788941 RepID=UPI001E5E9AA0|nr:type VI secretion system baseplate subunit TssK [Xenorhabdus sp. PB30.3]MCC8381218.1 type VI secretion system baseplate subunit TssK [Xenorhabdus sp. PB30.3]